MRRARRAPTERAPSVATGVSARGAAVALALGLAACAAGPAPITATPAPTHEAGALNVTALLDLSGDRTPNGGSQRDALQLWLDQQGTRTPRVRVRFVDVAGSEARTILELKRAAIEGRADAVIVGVPVDYDAAFARIVELAGLPVLFTLPIPDPATLAGGRWAFALAPTPAQLAKAAVDDATRRGVLVPSLMVSDESGPAVAERVALQAELAKRGLGVPLAKVTAADVAPRLAAPLMAARSVFFAGAVPAYTTAARPAIGSPSVPLLYFSYLAEPAALAELREAAALATWPGSRGILAPGAEASLRAAFVRAYADRYGPPGTHAAAAYDALSMLSGFAGTGVDAAVIRNTLEAAPFAGVATTFTFAPARHAGFATGDLVYLRWTAQRSFPMLAPDPRLEHQPGFTP